MAFSDASYWSTRPAGLSLSCDICVLQAWNCGMMTPRRP